MSGALALATPVEGRGCDGCTLCCKLMPVDELAKPAATWCKHCEPASGCRIYDDRPHGCRVFSCGWLVNQAVAPHWRPRESRMVLDFQPAMNRLAVHVDPGRPDAWRKPPYHAELRIMATRMAEAGGYVLVACGANFTMLLAHQEFPLGHVLPSNRIVFAKTAGPGGWIYDVQVTPGGADSAAGANVLPTV